MKLLGQCRVTSHIFREWADVVPLCHCITVPLVGLICEVVAVIHRPGEGREERGRRKRESKTLQVISLYMDEELTSTTSSDLSKHSQTLASSFE